MPDLDGFLAAIDAKIAALQQLRQSYIAAVSVGAIGQPSDLDPATLPPPPATTGATPASAAQPQPSGPIELPTGVFRDKGIADAIRLYLSLARRKQPFKAIQAALIEGGLATTSEFFEQTLSSTLHRLRKSGELLQFKDGWDLASSYPDSLRQRMGQTKESAPKRGKKKRAKKKADAKAAATPAKPKESKRVSGNPATFVDEEPLSSDSEPRLRAV
jgi:hypothetical protein